MPDESYQTWMSSDEARRFVVDNLRKSGIPLELKAKRLLRDSQFRLGTTRYLDVAGDIPENELALEQGIWREIDISATRKEERLQVQRN